MNQKQRPVEPGNLYALIDQADRVVVCRSPMEIEVVLFESADRADLEALKESVQVHTPEESFHCMCLGEPLIYLYEGSDILAEVTNHHGRSIRTSLWDSDALLVSQDRWIGWFDERGVEEPGREVALAQERAQQGQSDTSRWLAAMPGSIRTLWDESHWRETTFDIASFAKALLEEIPDKHARILALLSWFGSGAGPWSGYPSYERAAEKMLLAYPTNDIVEALQSESGSSAAVLEGAARLWGGWNFSRKNPQGLNEVPADLKAVLWEHTRSTTDEDKRGRARHAFKG